MKKLLIPLAIIFLFFFLLSAAGVSIAQDDPYGGPYGPPPDDSVQGQQAPLPGNQLPPPPQNSGAQGPQQPATAGPPPGVARLSFINGDVSTQRGDNGEWVAATLNTPVEPGDRVSTGDRARAEVQLDYANILRMSNNGSANVNTLERNRIQIEIGQGLASYSVLRGNEADSEIDTPNAAIHPLGEGEYRILVNSNEETQVTVRSGSVEIGTPQGSTRVEKGQMITIAGTGDNAQYKTDPAPGKDEWDNFNSDRDRRIASAQSWQRTNRYYTGSEDLDQNGVWSEVPDYGQVWTPQTTDPDWAPYRDGRWVYEPYYGWTWVSYEPWGWAPYHYGRWFVYGGSWRWWPGPVAAYPGYYPLWSPAYVSFFGFGGGGWGVNIGLGFGGWGRVGWLPCGPGDWFHPWYGGWGGRYSVVGIGEFGRFHEGFSPLGPGRFSNFGEALRNERVRAGLSSMGGREFGRGAVSMHQGHISEGDFRQSSAMTGRIPVTPSRESFRSSNREAAPSTIRGGMPNSQRFGSSSRTAGSFGNGSSGLRNGPGNFNRGTGGSAQPGWHSFNGAARTDRSAGGFANGRAAETNPGRGSFEPSERGSAGTQGGWNRFNSSRESQPQSSRGSGSVNGSVGGSGNGSQRSFDSPAAGSRGGYRGSSNSYNDSRPPLNMRQPIVTPRGGESYGNSGRSYNDSRGYGGGNNRGGNSGAGNSVPRGNYSAPRGGFSGGGGGGGYRGGGGGGNGGGNPHGGGDGSHGGGGHSGGHH